MRPKKSSNQKQFDLEFSQRLYRLFKEIDLTVRQAAEFGIASEGTVQKALSGKGTPNAWTLKKICLVTGESADKLLGLKE